MRRYAADARVNLLQGDEGRIRSSAGDARLEVLLGGISSGPYSSCLIRRKGACCVLRWSVALPALEPRVFVSCPPTEARATAATRHTIALVVPALGLRLRGECAQGEDQVPPTRAVGPEPRTRNLEAQRVAVVVLVVVLEPAVAVSPSGPCAANARGSGCGPSWRTRGRRTNARAGRRPRPLSTAGTSPRSPPRGRSFRTRRGVPRPCQGGRGEGGRRGHEPGPCTTPGIAGTRQSAAASPQPPRAVAHRPVATRAPGEGRPGPEPGRPPGPPVYPARAPPRTPRPPPGRGHDARLCRIV
jgi:hypothetical protein